MDANRRQTKVEVDRKSTVTGRSGRGQRDRQRSNRQVIGSIGARGVREIVGEET